MRDIESVKLGECSSESKSTTSYGLRYHSAWIRSDFVELDEPKGLEKHKETHGPRGRQTITKQSLPLSLSATLHNSSMAFLVSRLVNY